MAEIREVTGLGREMKTAALAAEIWNEYYAELLGSAQIAYMLNRFQSEEALHREEADGYRTFWVLEENGTTPVGYFLVKENEPVGKLFLSKLYGPGFFPGKGSVPSDFRVFEAACAGGGAAYDLADGE